VALGHKTSSWKNVSVATFSLPIKKGAMEAELNKQKREREINGEHQYL
jgi:hypothetical protein